MSLSPIDAHSHLPLDTPDSRAVLEAFDLRVLNITVAHDSLGGLDAQRGWYRTLIREHPTRFAWCTSFDPTPLDAPDFVDRAIAGIEQDLSAGAIAVKVWKHVGMEMRDRDGGWILVDDPRLAPIFAFLERRGIPLLMHIAEPLACWSPLDPQNPHYGYYSTHPQWHWHGRADVPTHERLIASRDAVVERHPKLRVIGAHYGSQEFDLRAVAERFERFPNYCVDTSARLGDLAVHVERDRPAVRTFFERYAGRILWGLDYVCTAPLSAMPVEQQQRVIESIRRGYERELRFFQTDALITLAGREIRGLGLTGTARDELFHHAARRAYPGL